MQHQPPAWHMPVRYVMGINARSLQSAYIRILVPLRDGLEDEPQAAVPTYTVPPQVQTARKEVLYIG